MYTAADPEQFSKDFIIEHFGGPIQRIRLVPVGRPGMCYWNASQVAVETGGKVVCGYLIVNGHDVLLEGLHHGVVELPSGELIDVTPFQHGQPETVSFVRNGDDVPSLTRPEYRDNIFVALKEHRLVQELADAHKQACIAQRVRAQVLEAAGIPFQGGMVEVDRRTLPDRGACLDAEKVAVARFRAAAEAINRAAAERPS